MNNNTRVTPATSGIQFGVLFGIIMVLEFVVGYTLDIDPISNPTFGVIINVLNYFILPLALIYIQCNNYKKQNSGFVSFGECLKIGVTICFIAGLIYGLFSVLFNFIFPEFMDEILRKTKTVMIKGNPEMTADQLEMAVSMTRKMMQPAFAVPITIVMFSFIGLIYSLIVGAIVKKDRIQSL